MMTDALFMLFSGLAFITASFVAVIACIGAHVHSNNSKVDQPSPPGGKFVAAVQVDLENNFFWWSRFDWPRFKRATSYFFRPINSFRKTVVISDANSAKAVLNDLETFSKPVELYLALNACGHNLVVSDGAEWKRMHTIAAPAFAPIQEKVWSDAAHHCDTWFDHMNASGLVEMQDLMTKLALMIIASSGFGEQVAWPGSPEDAVPPGHKITFFQSLLGVSDGIVVKAMVPQALLNFPIPAFTKTRIAYSEFDSYVKEIVHSVRNSPKDLASRTDLLSGLLRSSDEAKAAGRSSLEDQELVANMFVFMMAGHETTANTLCAALMCMALYPDVQEKLYSEASQVLSDGEKVPAFSKYEELPFSQAAFLEASRLYPVITAVAKTVEKDTVIPTEHVDCRSGQNKSAPEGLFLTKGTALRISIPGIHYNPNHYPDPDEYKPERFIDTATYKYNRDALMTFSNGIRGCMGRGFAIVEGTLLLAKIVSTFKVLPADPQQFAPRQGESVRQRRDRVYKPFLGKGGVALQGRGLKLIFEAR